MLFNSMDFLVFFAVVVFILFILPHKFRTVWLLIASYYFYMCWNPRYAMLIAFSTVATYFSSLLLERISQNKRAKRYILYGGCLLPNLGILFFFKYANFFLDNLSRIMNQMGFSTIDRRFDLLLPVGISFYTFQAISYTLDVYYGKIKPEKNIIKYALFVSFFPQLVAGPIERSTNLLPQIQTIQNTKLWNYERIREGLLSMFWGLFQKLVIADRIAILVDHVVPNYGEYGFVEISLAMVLFAIQIYCDFGGYTNIARGAAKVMGFELMANFQQPYLATSIKEFWRRWHISLTSWFTEYLYIPLGGNRKGCFRKYLNIAIVFSVSGLWHGASWNFAAWGFIHAAYQIVGDVKERICEKFSWRKREEGFFIRNGKRIITFVLVDIAWIFFASNGLKEALGLIRQMLSEFRVVSICELGLNKGNLIFLMVCICVLLFVDLLQEKNFSVVQLVNGQMIFIRVVIYLTLIWTIIMFGIYGVEYSTGTFIYFQF